MVDTMVWVDHLKIAIYCYGCHEGDAAWPVDSKHEEVYSTPGTAEDPVFPAEKVVDTEGHTDEQQEVCQHQVEQEQGVGSPDLQTAAEDPQSYHIARQTHYHLYDQHGRQNSGHQFLGG